MQAAGGFDGLLRDLASYNDEVPFLGWDNPLGGVDDWALDRLGVDDNEDLPKPTETFMEGKAFLNGSADAAAGIGVDRRSAQGSDRGRGPRSRSSAHGKNEGDVTFTVKLNARRQRRPVGGRARRQRQGPARLRGPRSRSTPRTTTGPTSCCSRATPPTPARSSAQALLEGDDLDGDLARRAREGHAVGLRGPRGRGWRCRASLTSRTRRTSTPRCAR